MKLLLFRFIDEEEFRKKINSIFKFAKVKKIDLIVFPENVPWMLDNELYKRLKDLVRSSKVSVLVTKRTKRFSSLLILPNKEVSFDKITHYGLDKKKFIAGKFIKIIKWKRFKFSVLICYDSFFPEYASLLKNKNLDFLIIQGFVPKGREDFWRSLIKIRSTELQISVIAVAGAENKKEIVTFVADPSFKIKEKLKFNREFLVVSVSKIKRIKKSPLLRGKTLFKKKLFGPFINDAKAGIYTRTINLNR